MMNTDNIHGSETPVRQGGGVGSILREERVKQGISIGDVSGRIKFAPKQIEALEADDYANLQEGAFLRGFVRSYARLLQLDEKVLIAQLPQAAAQVHEVLTPTPVEVPFPGEQAERNIQLLKIAAVTVLALLVVGGAVWRFTHRAAEVAPNPETLNAPAAVVAPVAKAPVAAALPAAPAAAPADPVVQPTAPAPAAPTTIAPQVVPPAAAPVAPASQAAAPAAPAGSESPATPDVAAEPPALRLVFKQASWVEVKDGRGAILLSKRGVVGSELVLNGKPPFSVAIARTAGVKLFFKGRPIDLSVHSVNGAARLRLE